MPQLKGASSREAEVFAQLGIAADPPDLLVEIVVVDRQPPPQAEAELVRRERADTRVAQHGAAREHPGAARGAQVHDEGEEDTAREVERGRSVQPARRSECADLVVTV